MAEYDKEFPKGAMREERDGLNVLAHCAIGNTPTAKREMNRFLKAYPAVPDPEPRILGRENEK